LVLAGSCQLITATCFVKVMQRVFGVVCDTSDTNDWREAGPA
jgi:hypothetical protein